MRAFEAIDSKRPCFFGSSPGHDQSRPPHAIKWVRAWTGRVKTQIHLGQSDGFHWRCSLVGDVSTLEPSGVNDELEILVKNVPVSLVLPSVSSVFSFSLHRRLITAGRPLIWVCYWFVFSRPFWTQSRAALWFGGPRTHRWERSSCSCCVF